MRYMRTIVMRGLLPMAMIGTMVAAGFAQQAAKNSATEAAPRPDKGWQDRHAKFLERVKQGNANVLFIGDSITQGWEGAGKGVWAEVVRFAWSGEPGHPAATGPSTCSGAWTTAKSTASSPRRPW